MNETVTSSSGAIEQGFGLLERAFTDRNWVLALAGTLTILVAIARQLKLSERVPDQWVPWVVIATSTFGSIGAGLLTEQPVVLILSTGLLVGVAAIGGWESVGKMVRSLIGKIHSARSRDSAGRFVSEPKETPPQTQPKD